MEIWTYKEALNDVTEVFNESSSLGLTVLQAISKTIYEYETVIRDNEIEKIMIFIILAKINLEHENTLHSHVKEELLEIMNEEILIKLNIEKLSIQDYEPMIKDLELLREKVTI